MMSGIRSKNTKIEVCVRCALHRRGFRFRIHVTKLPGRPDLVLPKYRAAIFVNGCFWHRHECHLFVLPKTRTAFWKKKLNDNRERDTRNWNKLIDEHWRILTVWECSMRGTKALNFDSVIESVSAWIRSDTKLAVIDWKGFRCGKDI